MGRKKKAADSNTGAEGVYVFDTATLDNFMERIDDRQEKQQKESMAVANEYRMAEKAGLNRTALGWIRKLEGMDRGVMLTVLTHFDKYRTHRLSDKESDLFVEKPRDALVSPPDPEDDEPADPESEPEPEQPADDTEGEPAPAPVEAVDPDKPVMDDGDFTMRAGAAARASGQPIDANAHKTGSPKYNRWKIGWQIKDDELAATSTTVRPVKTPTAEHATVQ